MTFLVAAVPSLKPSVRKEKRKNARTKREKGEGVSERDGKEGTKGEVEVELGGRKVGWVWKAKGTVVRTLEPSGDILEVLHSSGSGLIGEKKTRRGKRKSARAFPKQETSSGFDSRSFSS